MEEKEAIATISEISQPMGRRVVSGTLAIAATLGLLAVIVGLFFVEIPKENKEMATNCVQALIGLANLGFGFYLNDLIRHRNGIQDGGSK